MEDMFQARLFEEALYNTDWVNMTQESKKILLLIMSGSERKVNIRAGGTYELNLALFAQVWPCSDFQKIYNLLLYFNSRL